MKSGQIYFANVIPGGISHHMHHQAARLNELNLNVLRGCVYDPAHQGCFCSYALILLQLFAMTLSFSLIQKLKRLFLLDLISIKVLYTT